MCDIKMKMAYKCSALELPCAFIDDYFADCLPVYPLIYIWSLRRLLDGDTASLAEIGAFFHLTEGDVIKAWKHWENSGIVQISGSSQEMEITFLPVKPKKAGTIAPLTLLPAPQEKTQALDKPIPRGEMPRYTPPELECYSNESPDVRRLFRSAEQTLGLINHSIMNTVFSFYDWLRLPIEVIEYLFEYCAENDYRNIRYIEKCAIDWANHGINDIEAALEYVQKFDKNYRTIMRHMGATGYPPEAKRKYMDKWIAEWPLELITEACDRCVIAINKFDKKYTEAIFKAWREKGITTLEAAAVDTEKPAPATKAAKPRPNRFINFSQREIDFDKYEKLERAYLEQQLQ